MSARFSLRSLTRSLWRKPRTSRPPVLALEPRLRIVQLEDRIAPADMRDIAGLRFFTPTGTFSPPGAVSVTSSDVQVGLVPVGAASFQPLIDLPAGVSVTANSAKINSTLTAGGVAFTGNNLAFGFNQAAGKYTVSGTASFSAGGASISIGLGQNGTAGLLIQNNKLTAVDASVTSQFTIGKVDFTTTNLRLQYDSTAGTTYTITGSASAKFTGTNNNAVNLAVQFGPTGSNTTLPGLKIVNGQLTDLFVGVTGGFTLAGLQVAADNLSFFYNRQADTYGMFGGITISTAQPASGRRVLDNFRVQLGSTANTLSSPGILIKNGVLEKLDVSLNGAINLSSLSVQPDNLRVRYTRSTNVLQFTGGLKVSLASKFNGSVSLPNGGITIDTSTGKVQVNGIRLQITDTRIGPVGIRLAFIEYNDNGAGSFNLSGGAMVDLPAGLSVAGSFDVVNGRLQRIMISASKDPGFALGNTGVFVNFISAQVSNIDNPSQLQVTGTVGFTGGPSFRIAGQGRAFISGTVTVNLDVGASTLTLSGKVDLIGGLIPAGSGKVVFKYDTVNTSSSSVTATLNNMYLNGFVITSFTIGLSASGNVDVDASARVRIPEFSIPNIGSVGGYDLGMIGIKLHFDANDPASSTITFSASFTFILSVNLSVSLTFGGKGHVDFTVVVFPAIDTPNVDVFEPFFGTFLFTIPGIHTPRRTIDGGFDFNIGQILPNSSPPPGKPAKPLGYNPAVQIVSAEQVPGTNDLRVRFQTTTRNPANTRIRLTSSSTNSAGNRVLVDDLAFQAGTQEFIVKDAGSMLPGQVSLVATATDKTFDSAVGSSAFFPLPLLNFPLALAVPPTVNAPINTRVPVGSEISDVKVIDPSGGPVTFAGKVGVAVNASSGVLSIDPAVVPATVTVTGSGTTDLLVTGPAADVNKALFELDFQRPLAFLDDTITVTATRQPDFGLGSVEKKILVPKQIISLAVPQGPSIPLYTQGSPPASFFGQAVLDDAASSVLSNLTLSVTNYEAGADTLGFTLPAGSPLAGLFNPVTGLLTFDGIADVDDYRAALQSVTFVSTGGQTIKDIVIRAADPVGNMASFIQFVDMEVLGPATFGPVIDPGIPMIAAGTDVATFTVANAPIAPNLSVHYAGPIPLQSATVMFTGNFDATSDVLLFTPTAHVTGFFDSTSATLLLTASAGATATEFQQVFRSVSFISQRANPVPFAREVTFSLTNGVDASPAMGSKTFVQVAVPEVGATVGGTFANVPVPPGGALKTLFPDFTLTNPDGGLPAPSVVLGQFAPGTALIRATVVVTSSYVRGEDLLTFTPVGGITGTFFPETGELVLDGVGTLAEYQAVIRSVQYQNANPVPSTADRMVSITLDGGGATGSPSTAALLVQPQSDGLTTTQTAGTLGPLTLQPTDKTVPLNLGDLAYAPRPGVTTLVYTITDIPQSSQGVVRLADGTIAAVGMVTTIEQLRGATFVASDVPRPGTSSLTFTVAGVNPITGLTDADPLVRTLTFTTINVLPVTGGDVARTRGAAGVKFDLLKNDFDPNGDGLVFTNLTPASRGSLVVNDDFTVTYRAVPGFRGTDTFTYTVSDGAGGQTTGTVTVNVAASQTLVGFPEFAVGSDAGAATVTSFNPDGSTRLTVSPFEPSFSGGVRTASADFNGDGIADIVAGTGPGEATHVVILDGVTGAVIFSVDPFEASFLGGVYLAVGDVNGDGIPDLAITPDEGGGPRVDVYNGVDFAKLASFFGIDDVNFRGGARASIADMTADGRGDLIVVAGFGGGPRVAAFDGTTLSGTPRKLFGDFFAFEQALRNGIFVTSGDINGDGFADLICGGGPGGGPRVLVFDGKSLMTNQYLNLANFFGGDPNSRGGVRLAVKDLDGDDVADLVVGSGANAGSRVTAYLGTTIADAGTPPSALDFNAISGFRGGVFVG